MIFFAFEFWMQVTAVAQNLGKKTAQIEKFKEFLDKAMESWPLCTPHKVANGGTVAF